MPKLPPKWDWHPDNGRDDVLIKYVALGPSVNGGDRIRAHALHKDEDTPEECAKAAWEIWENLSGMTQQECFDAQRLKDTEAWYGTRWEALHALLKEADPELFKRACDIMANGNELYVPPTYAQQMNLLKARKEKLEKYLVDFRDECKQFSDKDINAFFLCHDLMEDIDRFLAKPPTPSKGSG
jgi:hypothetical protein